MGSMKKPDGYKYIQPASEELFRLSTEALVQLGAKGSKEANAAGRELLRRATNKQNKKA